MINNLQNINNNWIYQNNKLIEASYTLTVIEQKLIRLLASMIKKDDEQIKEYEFKTKDLIKILNTSDSRFYRDIDSITDLLMQRVIKIKNFDKKEFKKYHWIETAEYKNGILKLKINGKMKEFYLNLNWYTKYQLKNIMQFRSTYSFRLYEFFKQYENIGFRLITINELRVALEINGKQYPKYANLKQKVINKAISEININTDLHIELVELKEARKVVSIKFYIKQNKAINEIAATTEKPSSDIIKQVQTICHKHKITEREASCILIDANNNIDLIKQCYEYLLTKDNVKNIVGYMRKLVIGFDEPQSNIKIDNFNNFEQREYDFEELEKKLKSW
jgi:plasmid replication initiation protein